MPRLPELEVPNTAPELNDGLQPTRNVARADRPSSWPAIILPTETLESTFPKAQPASEPRIAQATREITVVDGMAGFYALAPEWARLASAALEPNVFYAPEIALPALRHLGSQVRLVAVWAPAAGAKGSRQLCGLFPLERQKTSQRSPVPVLGFWKHPFAYLTTPLIRADGSADTLKAFFDWLAADLGERGILRLEDVAAEGPFHHLLLSELRERGWTSIPGETYVRAFMHRASSAEAFLERALAGKRRKELRRLRSRLGELGTLETRELLPDEDPSDWLEQFLDLEARSWKGREGVAVAYVDHQARWFRAAMSAAHAAGKLELLGLFLDGRPIAMKLNLIEGEGSFAFKIAFDEAYARFSPGVLLELDNVERFHARPGLRWMDSCAAPNRFMINHLWPDRRAVQTLFLAPGRLGSLVLACLPLSRWVKREVNALRHHAPGESRG